MTERESLFEFLPPNEGQVFDLEGARIVDITFADDRTWRIEVAHRGTDDGAAVLRVAPNDVQFRTGGVANEPW